MSKPVICAPNSVNLPECNDCVVDCETFAKYQQDQEEIIDSLIQALDGKLDNNAGAIIEALGYEEIEISMTDTDGEIVGVKVLGKRVQYPFLESVGIGGTVQPIDFKKTVFEYEAEVMPGTEGSVTYMIDGDFDVVVTLNGEEIETPYDFEWSATGDVIEIAVYEPGASEPSTKYTFTFKTFIDVTSMSVVGSDVDGELDPTFDKNTYNYEWADGEGDTVAFNLEATNGAVIEGLYYVGGSGQGETFTDETATHRQFAYGGNNEVIIAFVHRASDEFSVDYANAEFTFNGETYPIVQGFSVVPEGLYAYYIKLHVQK